MNRVVIAGGPRTGKTTLGEKLASRLDRATLRHTDDIISTHDWSAASAEVAEWMTVKGPWVIEGVATARALRKFLGRHPGESPCDLVVYLDTPMALLTVGQAAMGKGCQTVFDGIHTELQQRVHEILVTPAIRVDHLHNYVADLVAERFSS